MKNQTPYIIAEIGSNHNGDIKTALNLIKSSAEAGASAVKFQLFKNETLYHNGIGDFGGYVGLRSILKKYELPYEWLEDLMGTSKFYGVDFIITPFDDESIEYLSKYDGSEKLSAIKISGYESTDVEFFSKVFCSFPNTPMIVTIGIGTTDPSFVVNNVVSNAQKDYKNKYGKYRDLTHKNKIVYLHSVHDYGHDYEESHLGCLRDMAEIRNSFSYIEYAQSNKDKWRVDWALAASNDKTLAPYGYSDHSTCNRASQLAAAMGATFFERHVTSASIPDDTDNPDHTHSLKEEDFKNYCEGLKKAWKVTNQKRTQVYVSSEDKLKNTQRVYVASETIKANARITSKNSTTSRGKSNDMLLPAKYKIDFDSNHYVALQDIEKNTPFSVHNIEKIA